MNPVRLCRLGVFLLQGQKGGEELAEEWSAVWTTTAAAIKEFTACEFDVVETKMLAQECLALIELLDTSPKDRNKSYAAWLESFDPSTSVFPEHLFQRLDCLVPGREGERYRRIRRLRERRRLTGSTRVESQ